MIINSDLYRFLIDFVKIFNQSQGYYLLSFLIGGIVLGITLWIGCSCYARLWNLRFRMNAFHHFLCGIAALFTVLFSIAFAVLKYAQPATDLMIAGWEILIMSDASWNDKTFQKIIVSNKFSGNEELNNFSLSGQNGNSIPLGKFDSNKTLAYIFTNEAIKNFKYSNPYLGKILSDKTEIPEDWFLDSLNLFLTNNPQVNINGKLAVTFAAKYLRQSLDPRIHRMVIRARITIFILFLLLQALPYGLVGISAYKNLKIAT